jgi:hypothetical protein
MRLPVCEDRTGEAAGRRDPTSLVTRGFLNRVVEFPNLPPNGIVNLKGDGVRRCALHISDHSKYSKFKIEIVFNSTARHIPTTNHGKIVGAPP